MCVIHTLSHCVSFIECKNLTCNVIHQKMIPLKSLGFMMDEAAVSNRHCRCYFRMILGDDRHWRFDSFKAKSLNSNMQNWFAVQLTDRLIETWCPSADTMSWQHELISWADIYNVTQWTHYQWTVDNTVHYTIYSVELCLQAASS